MTNLVCAVAIDTAIYALDKLYDYLVPEALCHAVQAGCRVRIPFGRGNRRIEGVILAVKDAPSNPDQRLKPIIRVLDSTPVLSATQIQLAIWMREHLFCTFYACLRQMLPTGLWLQVREQFTLVDASLCPQDNSLARTVMDCFSTDHPTFTFDRLQVLTNDACTHAVLEQLTQCGALTREDIVRPRAQAKTEKSYQLYMDTEQALERVARGRSAVQMDVVSLLSDGACMTHKELVYMTGASDTVLRTMVKNEILHMQKVEVMRLPEVGEIEPLTMTALNPAQQAAYEQLCTLQQPDQAAAALLFGVTGSGKTQVYLHLIAHILAQGKSVILLLPEIGLTPQFIRIFMGHFGEKVAVLHSALSVGERFDSWNRIQTGQATVVIGTRSAIFAPVRNLGLIIIDEEQDGAYKSEQSPRYHARDIAKYRVAREHALLVLGSATPSVETYHATTQGKFPVITLPERFGGTSLPQVVMADRKGDVQRGFSGMIGSVLYDQMQQALAQNKQIILFLNRRGNSRTLGCATCGWVPSCTNCSAPMTYHSHNERIMCHYCGASFHFDGTCPECYNRTLFAQNAGTQKVEQELHDLFPHASVLRMDADSMLGKNAHMRMLDAFGKHHADILLGTQMVAKGLDFANVALVGVLDADQMLFAQDYRATERTFSLITQVVGRAGRRNDTGQAVIQTYVPNHTTLLQAARQDYLSFYEQEIERRHALRCPPVAQLLFLQASGVRESQVMDSLLQLRNRLLSLLAHHFSTLSCTVLGPTPATVVRVAGKYRYHLILRCADTKARRILISGVLTEFLSNKQNSGVSLIVDQNPDMI